MPRYNRDVENTLLGKFEFSPAPTKGDDHRWLQLTLPGLPAIITKFSHTKEDIGDPLWRKIAMQLKVRSQYLTGMISCTNSRDAYYNQVRTAPFPPWPFPVRAAAPQPAEPAKSADRKKHKGKRRR